MGASPSALPRHRSWLRRTAIAIAVVLTIIAGRVIWERVRTHQARMWTLELPSLKRETLFATAKLRAAQFERSDWHHLGHEALRLDSRMDLWIRDHRSQLPVWAAPLLPAGSDSDLRWRALSFAWISSQQDVLQRREDLLRMALTAPDPVRWRAVDLVFRDLRRRSETNAPSPSLSIPMLRLLQRFAEDPDPRVRIQVALALEWPAPGGEAIVGEILDRLGRDPDPATANAASRILARRPATP